MEEVTNNESEEFKVNFLGNIILWIALVVIVILIDYLAVVKIINDIPILKNRELSYSYYMTIANIIVNGITVLFSISLVFPNRKVTKTKRYIKRISYLLNLLIGFGSSIAISNAKILLQSILDEGVYYLAHEIPLIVITLFMLITVFTTKKRVNFKSSSPDKIVRGLYVLSFVVFIYGVFNFIRIGLDIEGIIYIILSILIFIFTFIFHRSVPKSFLTKKRYHILTYKNKKIKSYSKNSETRKKDKIPALLSGLTAIACIVIHIVRFLAYNDYSSISDATVKFYLLVFILASLVTIICTLSLFKCLLKNNSVKMLFANLYTVALITGSILISLISSKDSIITGVVIEGRVFDLTAPALIILIIIPLAFYKHAKGAHELKPFEECTKQLIIADISLLIYLAIGVVLTGEIPLIIDVIPILLNIIFLSLVKKNGFLEYTKASKSEQLECDGEVIIK